METLMEGNLSVWKFYGMPRSRWKSMLDYGTNLAFIDKLPTIITNYTVPYCIKIVQHLLDGFPIYNSIIRRLVKLQI